MFGPCPCEMKITEEAYIMHQEKLENAAVEMERLKVNVHGISAILSQNMEFEMIYYVGNNNPTHRYINYYRK